ncbi:hypothetical protein SSX86_033172, partial [Deinandra increscens subsp. villosa]
GVLTLLFQASLDQVSEARNFDRELVETGLIFAGFVRKYKIHMSTTRPREPSNHLGPTSHHGPSYTVYGKPDVRRLMFEVFALEQTQPKAV